MTDDRVIAFIWIAGAMALVGSAILHRGLGGRGAIKLALIWLGIILAAWAAVATIGRLDLLAYFT